MSSRAVLAHEYYGHRPNREEYLIEDAEIDIEKIAEYMSKTWYDEYMASYNAAKYGVGLDDTDRYYLILDAIERKREAGIEIIYDDFIRSVLYGKD